MRAFLITFVVLGSILICPLQTVASQDSVRLGIEPVDSELPYFDLTLEPGASTELTIRFSNHGEIGTGAAIFAADVYTLHGGGMGMADIDDPRSGPTRWLDLEHDELVLEPGESIERTFSLRVPEDAAPGDYIMSVVIQNSEPIDIDGSDTQFDQTIRQGIAIAIDVPGVRESGLEIAELRHQFIGERSVLEVDVENVGNTHLRPAGDFALLDDEGAILAETSISLDTVYAGTGTVVEVTFSDRLPPGDYRAALALADTDAGVEAEADDLAFDIESPDTGTEGESVADAVSTGEDTATMSRALVALLAGAAIMMVTTLLLIVVLIVRRAREREFQPVQTHPSTRMDASAPAESYTRAETSPDSPRRIRQLKPPAHPR